MARAALLLQIPDVETNQSVTISELIAAFAPAIPEDWVVEEAEELVKDKFVKREGNRLQKVNGWMPLQKRLLAIEVKLKRVEEAMVQAQNNLGFADESFVGLPKELAVRVASSRRRGDFLKRGVGLLSVSQGTCEMLIRSRAVLTGNPVFRFCCVERFWRNFSKGS
jgi:hypothetical protein